MCWKNGNFSCPDDCTNSSQGNCDKTTGKCNCINGYTGKKAFCINKFRLHGSKCVL